MADFRYELDGELIIIPVYLTGKNAKYNGAFILDTGAAGIIIDHSIAEDLGYSAIDAVGFSSVASAVGRERGYRLVITALMALGHTLQSCEVRCHDLKDQGVEGLVGMTFLKQFDWCLHPTRRMISVQTPKE